MLKKPLHLPKLFLKLNKVSYGKNLKLLGWPFVFRHSDSKITIGNSVTFNSNFFSNLIGLNHRTVIVARNNSNIKIGNKVGLSGVTVYAWNSIEIGDNTIIGANTKIFDTDFHPVNSQDRLNNKNGGVKTAPVKIGKNCFVGVNAIILKGTEIGDNCTVGAGAVVSGKFEPNSIIAGNPAKVIKKENTVK